MDLMVVKDFIK